MPSLSITQGDKGVLLKCFAGCTVESILKASGLKMDDIFSDTCGVSGVSEEEIVLNDTEIGARDYWYTEVFEALELTEEHREELSNRGLDDDEIAKFFFRTWDRQKVSKIVPSREIPGYTTKSGWKRFSGLVMPIMDPKGRVWGVCIKRDDGEPKYSWLSHDGKLGKIAHFHLEDPKQPIIVVEGILKSFVAGSLGGHQNYIGLGGISSWKVLSEWSKSQKAKRTFHIAYDCDGNPDTAKELERLRNELVNQGHKVFVFIWKGEKAKGYDDALKSGVPIRLVDWSNRKTKPRGIGGDSTEHSESLRAKPLAEIRTRKIEWLINGWIPLGTFVKLDGDPGDGKGFIVAQWCARLSNGEGVVGDSGSSGPRNCIIINNEDDPECVTGPRLIAAGADPNRVFVVQTADTPFCLPEHLDKLEQLIDDTNASFVVLDPLPSFIDGKTNSNSDKDVRNLMVKISKLAADKKCTIMGVFHMNKGSDQRAIYRSSGSVAFNGQARASFMLLKHPNDKSKRIVWNFKNNWGETSAPVEYQFKDGTTAAQVVYKGPTTIPIENILKAQGESTKNNKAEKKIARLSDSDVAEWIKTVIEKGKTLDSMELMCFRVGIPWGQCRKIMGELCIIANQSATLKEVNRGKVQSRQGVSQGNKCEKPAEVNEGLSLREDSTLWDECIQGLQRGLEIHDSP